MKTKKAYLINGKARFTISNFKTETEVAAGALEDSYGGYEYYDTITGTVTINGINFELRRHWSDDSDFLHVIDSKNTIIGRINFNGTDFKITI